MAVKISFVNQKGGVGKTFLTLHLSGALDEAGYKVLIVDLDPQGNISTSFIGNINAVPFSITDILDEGGVEISQTIQKTKFSNIDIIPANNKLRGIGARLAGNFDSQYYLAEDLETVKNQYDFILMDCPTRLEIEARLSLVASDYAIIPLQCLATSIDGSVEVIQYIDQVKNRANPNLKLLGIVINMFDSKRTIENSYRERLREKYKRLVFETEFKRSVKFPEAETCGQPITSYLKTSNEAKTMRNFVEEIIKNVKEK